MKRRTDKKRSPAEIKADNSQIFRGELGEPIQNICCRCGAEVEEEMKG